MAALLVDVDGVLVLRGDPIPGPKAHKTLLKRLRRTSRALSRKKKGSANRRKAKAKLAPFLSEGNRAKTMEAPVTAIIATDHAFYEHLPTLFPHADARSWFVGNQPLIDATAFRNATLHAAYVLLAARALGLDCGPMSGFSNRKVDEAFFPDGRTRSNFLCSLGCGDPAALYPDMGRRTFEETCSFA